MKRLATLSALTLILSAPSWSAAKEFSFVTLEFPPLEFADANGKAQGIAVDIVTQVMTSLGHTVDVKVFPWARGLEMTNAGEVDAIFTAYKTPEREAFLDYSKQVLIPQSVYFYAAKGSPVAFDGDLSKLTSKKIGVTSTISYGKKFDDYKDKLTTERVADLEQNFQKLAAGRIDLVVSNVYTAETTLQKMQLGDKIVRLPVPVQESIPSYIAFSKKRNLSALRDEFDKTLAAMIKSGQYAAVMKKWGVSAP
jgi:polar amino acid transport system substrate-binding protein